MQNLLIKTFTVIILSGACNTFASSTKNSKHLSSLCMDNRPVDKIAQNASLVYNVSRKGFSSDSLKLELFENGEFLASNGKSQILLKDQFLIKETSTGPVLSTKYFHKMVPSLKDLFKGNDILQKIAYDSRGDYVKTIYADEMKLDQTVLEDGSNKYHFKESGLVILDPKQNYNAMVSIEMIFTTSEDIPNIFNLCHGGVVKHYFKMTDRFGNVLDEFKLELIKYDVK